MEKRSGRVELRQNPNRKNHYNRHKSRKFGPFVEGAQYDFPDPHRNHHGRRWRRQHRQYAVSPIGIRDRAQAAGINKKVGSARISRLLVFVLGSFVRLLVRRRVACAAWFLRGAGRTHGYFERWNRLLRCRSDNRSAGGVRIGSRRAWRRRREADRHNGESSEMTVNHCVILVGGFNSLNDNKQS